MSIDDADMLHAKALRDMHALYVAEVAERVRLQQQVITLSGENHELRLRAAFDRYAVTISGRTPEQIEAEYQAWRCDGAAP